MSIAVSVNIQDMTAERFDSLKEGLGDDAPEGMLMQTAGPAESGGFRVFSVWESKEDYERFREDRLMPAVREALGDEAADGPSSAEVYELHDVFIRPKPSS